MSEKSPKKNRIIWRYKTASQGSGRARDKETPGKSDKIPVIELFDDDGEKTVLEVLDTIEYKGGKYILITPYYQSETMYSARADVFVMKEIVHNGETMLENVEGKALLKAIYDLFKKSHSEFKFSDSDPE